MVLVMRVDMYFVHNGLLIGLTVAEALRLSSMVHTLPIVNASFHAASRDSEL